MARLRDSKVVTILLILLQLTTPIESLERSCQGTVKTKIYEGRPPGTIIFNFTRRPNLRYSFSKDFYSSSARAIFRISRDGVVTNRVSLDREDARGSSFSLTVLTKQLTLYSGHPGRTTACSLLIKILDVNDNGPRFAQDLYTGTIKENQPIGSLVGDLQGVYATDADQGVNSVYSYKILPDYGADEYFEATAEEIDGVKFLNIKTRQMLDREHLSFYIVTVEASDGGKIQRKSTSQIRINVMDDNDCSPVFRPTQYTLSVFSSTPITTSVMKIHAQDEDEGANGEVYYYFKSPTEKFFTINAHTGVITVARHLDCLSHSLEVIAQDRGQMPRQTSTHVKVNILRDHHFASVFINQWSSLLQPRFAKSSYLVRIREDLPPTAHVLHANVNHLTQSTFLPQFRLISDLHQVPFQVDINSSVLSLTNTLNYHSSPVYEFQIGLYSMKEQLDVTKVRIEVDAVDKNHERPVFASANRAISVARDADTTLVAQLKAHDSDEGVNGLLKYHIRSGNHINMFTVNENNGKNNGKLNGKPSLRWQPNDKYELTVEARDCAEYWKKAQQFLLVRLVGQQDCAPIFARSLYNVTVRENERRGLFVAVTDAKDCEQRKIQYTISSGNFGQHFTIDRNTGIIRTRKVLDRETTSEYTLEITAKTNFTSAFAQVLVNIEDVNDNNPEFAHPYYQVKMLENSGKVDNLLCLFAQDKDNGENSSLRYDIISGDERNLFKINPSVGTLSLLRSLNYEDQREHVLKIRVNDHGEASRSTKTMVKVLVGDVNDAPRFSKNDVEVSILEEKPVGSTVLFLAVSDEDHGYNGEFQCSYENIETEEFGKFKIGTTKEGCVIQNLQILDWLDKDMYTLKVHVTDKSPPQTRKSDTAFVRIKIKDINNHAPEFTQTSYWSSLRDDTPLSTATILQVQAKDKDSGLNADIAYSIIKQSSESLFSIHHQQGRVTSNRRLVPGLYTLQIAATDKGSPQRRQTVHCNITVFPRSIKFPPKMRGLSKRSLRENIAELSLVTQIRLRGSRDHVTFSIVGGNIDNVFQISEKGNVYLARALDYEKVQKYELIVRAVYKHSQMKWPLAFEDLLEVEVLDMNDNHPNFTVMSHPYIIDINKQLKADMFITQITAYDADSHLNGDVTYSIKQRLDPVFFAVNSKTGRITVTKTLASRDAPYTFIVIARDEGTPSKETELEVHVRIHRNNRPLQVHGGNNSVIEGPQGINTTVMKFKTQDVNNDVIYSIINGNDDNAFCVDVTGTVYSVRELDREMKSIYNLEVLAENDDDTAHVNVDIFVIDVNDNSPQFPSEPLRIFVKENTTAQKVGTIDARDKDWGGNSEISYSIVCTSSKLNQDMFNIVGNGSLIALKLIQGPEHVLTVVAKDRGSPSRSTFTRVIITVEDDNDHAPRFVARDFKERIPYRAPIGYPVLQTLATDDDEQLNAQIRYNIESAINTFNIDESTGWIKVASRLLLGTFQFLVSATDKGTPARNSMANVTIIVEPEAGSPRFLQVFPPGYRAFVKEDRNVSSRVLKITAASMDLVTYTITDPTLEDFYIDEISGWITIARQLDYEQRTMYEFMVVATDRNDRRSQAHVSIEVVNVNDNAPRILNKNSKNVTYCRIPHEAAVGTLLGNIHAIDDDSNSILHYSLEENSNKPHFEIDSFGDIRLSRVLKDIRTNLFLVVTVKDSDHPTLQDYVIVNITILKYTLKHPSPMLVASEATPIDTKLAPKTFPPKVFPPNKYTAFSLVYPGLSPFIVLPTNGKLVLKQPLDYETQAQYSLTVRMLEKTGSNDYVDVDVTIAVKDENDNHPVFNTIGSMPLRVTIHRMAKQGTLVYHFNATDKDTGSNGEVEFRMEDSHQGVFQIGRKTGQLKTTGVTFLHDQYNVTVEAYDKGTPSLRTRASIIIDVKFIKPRFDRKEYSFNVFENASVGENIGVIKAEGFGVPLTYELNLMEARIRDNPFNIHPNTGVLSLTKPVDHENSKERVFNMVVLARAQETQSTGVVVRVKDVNDCSPQFYKARYVDMVPESVPIGTTVVKVHAMDCDTGFNGEVRYSINNDHFLIDSHSGLVTTAVALDYETIPEYVIIVTAHDLGAPVLTGQSTLVIRIGNSNDNQPVFGTQLYSLEVMENARPGSMVVSVTATDADNDPITYDITSGNTAGLFTIDKKFGTIRLNDHASVRLVNPSYRFNVTASDGLHKVEAVVNVMVKDINDHAPVFPECHKYSPSIPEGSPVGTTVIKVRATDEDRGDNGAIQYAIVHPNTLFQIDRKTGEVETLVDLFNRQEQKWFSIRVKAIDGRDDMPSIERRETSCSFTVTITDINDHKPVFSMKNYQAKVKENVNIGYTVIQVHADDEDERENAHVSYSFVKSTSLFRINDETGVITTQASLLDENKIHILRVIARDNGQPRLQTQVEVTVTVIDSTSNPLLFQQSFYEIKVPENITKYSTIGDVVVTSSKAYYRIIPGNIAAENKPRMFVIGAISGRVQVQGRLDRETTPVYTLTIQAENDENPPSSTNTTLKIVVTDVNDCSPEFLVGEYVATIRENTKQGTPVLAVTAIDRDAPPYDRTMYSIERNTNFEIDRESGIIKSKVVFDREKLDRYKFVVKATDVENPSLWSNVIVKVKISDDNDQMPKFSQKIYKARISENAAVGTEVITVLASDDHDEGSNAKITFDIENGNEQNKFQIDATTGRVVVNGHLDYEAETYHNLTITAWDGKFNDTAILTIVIINENDNEPVFDVVNGIHYAKVPENSRVGTIVTNLVATDKDSSDFSVFSKTITYELSNQVKDIFSIELTTGIIRTASELDRELKDEYIFEAYANDGYGKSGSVTVVIRVTDRNDNAPKFTENRLTAVVYENKSPGTFVKDVIAIDLDDKNNAVINYVLVGDLGNVFAIDKYTGKLVTRVVLDREEKAKYRITVNATDNGLPPLFSTTVVEIHVLDTNDNKPVFKIRRFEKWLPEKTAQGSKVFKLKASDKDVGLNAKLRYFLKDNQRNVGFRIDADSGDVIVDSVLDYERKTVHEFEVKVKDSGDPYLFDIAKVIIHLEDSNDEPPYFTRTYETTLVEGVYNRTKILQLEARDNDRTAVNRQLYYEISDGDPTNVFSIDTKTGVLFVVSGLDYETTTTHVLTIRATNKAPGNLFGETEVKIIVTDINDNPPDLTNSSKIQSIYENLPEGVHLIGTLHAIDRDMDPNGKPFTFGLLRASDMFQLDWRTGVLTTNRTFDREQRESYALEVWVRDSGVPPLTNNITVRINIMDRNDHQHREGHLELTVNLMAQQTISPNIAIGRIFVDDHDTDDPRHYNMLTGDTNTFKIEENTGYIYMKQTPLAGKYTFRVQVSDRESDFSPVVCTARITVNQIPQEAFKNSITLRFLYSLRQDWFTDFLGFKHRIAKVIDTRPENVDIFSIQDVTQGDAPAVDVRLAAHGSPYYDPEKLIALLKVNRRGFERGQRVIIGYDACASEPCHDGGCRSEVIMTGDIETFGEGSENAYSSLVTKTKIKCGTCENLYETTKQCDEQCHGNACHMTKNVFTPTFPESQSEKTCVVPSTWSFVAGNWLWFRSLRSCHDIHLSLEFSTLKENGVLLYNGPIQQPRSGEIYDFIAIELVDGKIQASFSFGQRYATKLVISQSGKLNDGNWHLVEVVRKDMFIRVVLDKCRSSFVTSYPRHEIEDKKNCEVVMQIENATFNILNTNEPLQIGGMFSPAPGYTEVLATTYEGCIRNVKENREIFNQKDVLKRKGTKTGCPVIEKHCEPISPCYGEAKCVPTRTGFTCICPYGYQGLLCDTETISHWYGNSGFMEYQLTQLFLEQYNTKFITIEMMIRTRYKNGGVLMSIWEKSSRKHLTLKLTEEEGEALSLTVLLQLGNHEHKVQLKNALTPDGQWHHVIITRDRHVLHLGIDRDTKPKRTSGTTDGDFILLNLDKESRVWVGGLGKNDYYENYFTGCIKDIRIDGQAFPGCKSTPVAKLVSKQGVTEGCQSKACDKARCSEREFCHDMWKKYRCLYRECNSNPCHNGATCIDNVVNDQATFVCQCRKGFNGTTCSEGSDVKMLVGDGGRVNYKLVIGLSCFVLLMAFVTLLIICYHRYQIREKLRFDEKMKVINAKKYGVKIALNNLSAKGHCAPATTTITTAYPSMYSTTPLIHTCNNNQSPRVPQRHDSLQSSHGNPNTRELPEWDMLPVIDLGLTPDRDSLDEEDYIEYPEDDDVMTPPEKAPRLFTHHDDYMNGSESLESLEDEQDWDAKNDDVDDKKTPSPDNSAPVPRHKMWNDIEEFGRRFLSRTKEFLGNDDESRPNSDISTTSNTSSVITVVENKGS